MAAAPRGADNLQYEAEEAAILRATRNLGMDLTVEESGTLPLLAAMAARENPAIVQISCHGTLQPRPALLLEDAYGDPALTEPEALLLELGRKPRLLFLSACHRRGRPQWALPASLRPKRAPVREQAPRHRQGVVRDEALAEVKRLCESAGFGL